MVRYLGVTLSYNKPHLHVENRTNACRRAFYALQGAGFNNKSTDVNVISYVWNTAIRPVLMYGLPSVFINRSRLHDLEKTQQCISISFVEAVQF
jgi:hypothetical protein